MNFGRRTLADVVFDEVLDGEYVVTSSLGWLRWDGKRWIEVPDDVPLNALRQWVLEQAHTSVERGRDGDTEAASQVVRWVKLQARGRLENVLHLARGRALVSLDEFDADPDLLNTPDGVVDLRTGNVRPHDPSFLMTKITRGSYRPGRTHPDWERALQALDSDERKWLQRHSGQAATGHPAKEIVLAQGSGANGKTALLNSGLLLALGDYARVMPTSLIQSVAQSHASDIADLRGRRYVVAEEMTEDRALDITVIKRLTDVPVLSARRLYRDPETFTTSHTIVASTNNQAPIVSETDHGTWRRLRRLVFPYRFRKRYEDLQGPNDRYGDDGLKSRLEAGDGGRPEAIITWVVEGAKEWYRDPAGALEVTPAIATATREWRKMADRVTTYWDECLERAEGYAIIREELHEAFNAWLESLGYKPWTSQTFAARFNEHEETLANRV